ncbi:MAG: hypothetical protein R3F65_23260 [bacterium]
MIRRLLITACASLLLAGTAFAEQASPPPVADGAVIGQRLAAVGTVRPLGDDLELTVRGLGAEQGAEQFTAWRELADVVAETAAFLHQRRIVITAHAPAGKEPTAALLLGQQRAHALREALQARGVAPERILTTVRPPIGRGAGAVDFVITFERRAPKGPGIAAAATPGPLADVR